MVKLLSSASDRGPPPQTEHEFGGAERLLLATLAQNCATPPLRIAMLPPARRN